VNFSSPSRQITPRAEQQKNKKPALPNTKSANNSELGCISLWKMSFGQPYPCKQTTALTLLANPICIWRCQIQSCVRSDPQPKQKADPNRSAFCFG